MITKETGKLRRKGNVGHSAKLTVDNSAPLLRVRANIIRRWSQMGILEYLRMGSRGYRISLQEEFDNHPKQ